MMKLRLGSFFCSLIAIVLFCEVSNGMWVPDGTAYSAPESGTLVISEDYGTEAGGVGTWSNAGGGSVVATTDSIILTVAENYAHIPLPWRPRATNYVIDIGIKGWSTTKGGTIWAGILGLENSDSGQMQRFVMMPAGELFTPAGSESTPFAQGTGHVVRLSDPTGPWAPYSCVATVDSGEMITDNGATGGIALNALRFYTGANGGSSVEIAWLRVYEGVTSTDPALVPEPMTIALLGLGGLFIRRRK